jgi:hypothetical protein
MGRFARIKVCSGFKVYFPVRFYDILRLLGRKCYFSNFYSVLILFTHIFCLCGATLDSPKNAKNQLRGANTGAAGC